MGLEFALRCDLEKGKDYGSTLWVYYMKICAVDRGILHHEISPE